MLIKGCGPLPCAYFILPNSVRYIYYISDVYLMIKPWEGMKIPQDH